MISPTTRVTDFGAYGFRLQAGIGTRFLAPASSDRPLLQIVRELGARGDFVGTMGDGRAHLPLLGTGSLTMERDPLRATFQFPRLLGDEELIHPYLAPAAAIAAHWQGRETFHAGAVMLGDSAWAIVGDRGAGKSSILAALTLEGRAVLSDDLLVVDDGRVFVGPRSIDLREEAAARLGVGTRLGLVGQRERWRLELSPAPDLLPLHGWIFLDWDASVRMEPISAGQRVPMLLRQRSTKLPSPNDVALLDLVTLPAWLLRRPAGWESMEGALDLLGQLDR